MLGSIFSNAQRRGIDSIYVNPTQANSNDSIIVIAMVRSTSTPCRFDSVAINTIDSNITVNAYYIVGIGASPCFTQDTIALGELTPKRYTLKYNAIDNYAPFKSVSDTIYFTVNQVIGIKERNNPVQSVSVYPNPGGAAINLNVYLAKAVAATIRITDTQGRIVYTEQVQLNQGETVHGIVTKKLSSGIYNLSLWSEGALLEEEKIIDQH